MTEDEILAEANVSRETRARLESFAQLLRKWNQTINLVGAASLDSIWHRHVADSVQLWPLIRPSARTAIDFGSGGGFPALVLATLAAQHRRPLHYILVEADSRKAAFLATAARELEVEVSICNRRLEALTEPRVDLVTARAFAPLSTLLAHTARLRKPAGQAVFLKGRSADKELDEARRLWKFDFELHPSLTDPEAAVVEIGAINGPAETDHSRPRQPEGRRG